ncbi:hypothetical protein KAZ82_01375 [Candidatus Babeliales bacterium]|nr:hypothetical protein [Candidatus Babeliales bacterium]
MIFQNIYNQKIVYIRWSFAFCFSLILIRLIHLQIVQYQQLKLFSVKNFLRFKSIPTQRGNILDCNGIALATNRPVTQLHWKGSGNQSLNTNQIHAIEIITRVLNTDRIPTLAKFKHTEKYKLELMIASEISEEQLCLIAEQCSDSGNIIFNTVFERFYPFETLACHILGYLGDVHLQYHGKMGLEKIFEEQLRGDPTIMMQQTNSFGAPLETEKIKDGCAGNDLKTSIDLELQQIVETAMQEELEGSCLLMDPETGMIKALVSKPNFNPSLFLKKLTPEQWQQIQDQKLFLNRALNASYPPASIFKLVTIAAALEKKLITTTSHFVCNGYCVFKDRQYFCSKNEGHGYIDTKDALAFSCNIPFFEIAKRLHIDTLAEYAHIFGLGTKTNIIFGEQSGLIPTNDWKIATKGERWWVGETLSATIGQSFLLTTPIQIACMIGAIFNGNLVKPQIIADAPVEKKPLEIDYQTRMFLQECMRAATLIGTAQRINKIGTLTIFAKTGTAQTKTRKKNQKPGEEKATRLDCEHAWFVSYFYTDHSKPLVLVMLLEHVGRSTYATKVAHKFFKSYVKWEKGKQRTARTQ